MFRKYLEGNEINEESIQKFNGEYDKVKMLADILNGENNDFGDDSLRLIILEKILGGREDDIYSVLGALDNVSEDKIAELQGLIAELKDNEEEFVKCFADMSAVEKYNLERAAFYDKNGNYCKSQWMKVDKDGIHEASRGPITWIKNIWNALRFLGGIAGNAFVIWAGFFCDGNFYIEECWNSNKYLTGSEYDYVNPIILFKALQIITCLPSFIGLCRGCTNFISIVQGIVAIIDLIIVQRYFWSEKFIGFIKASFNIEDPLCYNIINKVAVVCAVAAIFFNFLEGLLGFKYVFNKKINRHLAFLLNKKFRYIKNYVETLKKIHILIKGDDVLAGAFKKELASLEKVFGDEASEETKHMLTEMDKQKLYDSFDDVEDTGEAMLLFDKNKDIFSDCIVDVNKINACVALKMNVPAEEIKKLEEENKNQEACKKEKDLSSEKVKEVNPEGKKVDKNKKKENEPEEKRDVEEETAKKDENKKREYSDEEVQYESKKNKKRGNKKRKRKRSEKKRRVRTNKNKRKIEDPRNENTSEK